jgi:hypothetical protein
MLDAVPELIEVLGILIVRLEPLLDVALEILDRAKVGRVTWPHKHFSLLPLAGRYWRYCVASSGQT